MGALEIDKGTIKRIYALGAALGMKGSGHDDALHALVRGLTGKESVKALTPAEAREVERELARRKAQKAGTAQSKKPARRYEELPGGLSAGQQKMIWYLMFELEKYDPSPDGVQLRDRLCGLIEKQCRVTAFPTDPFRFVRAQQGSDLIEGLKQMAQRAELRYLHSPENLRKLEARHRAE